MGKSPNSFLELREDARGARMTEVVQQVVRVEPGA
jgi:hypothetical protein